MNARAIPFKIALRESDRVLLDGRTARVAYVTPDCVLLEWEEPRLSRAPLAEHAAPRRSSADDCSLSPWLGEGSVRLTHLEVFEAWDAKQLQVVDRRRPAGRRRRTAEEVLAALTAKGAARVRSRLTYVEIMLDLIAAGSMEATHRSISEQLEAIHERHATHGLAAARAARSEAGLQKHAAAKVAVDVKLYPPSISTLMGYLAGYQAEGVAGLLDRYHRSGNRKSRFPQDVTILLGDFVRDASREEGTSIALVGERVRDAFAAENERRARASPRVPQIAPIPGREAIRSELARISPLEYALRTRSRVAAERAMRPVGQAPEADRALQFVLCDEWTVDLKVLLLSNGAWDRLSQEERDLLAFDSGPGRKPGRLHVSMAIDLATHAVLAVQFALNPSTDLTLRVIEMIMLDKDRWASAGEGLCGWPMRGLPESLIVDRRSSFDSDRTYAAMAALDIDHLGCVAGMPYLKGTVERLFRTAHERLIARFAGRTHSNPYKRPDYEDDAKARMTPDLLIRAFLRFVVDIHHTTPLKALGGRTPLQAWQDEMRDGYGVNEPPDTPTMQRVFGTPLTPSGLRVLDIQYHSDALADRFRQSQQRKYELRWWPHDVGAIEVLTGETWRTVPAVRDGLKGVPYEEVRASLGARAQDPDAERIQREASRYFDGLDPAAPTIRQTYESTYTPQRIEALERDLVRGFVTSERKEREGPARWLLSDVVEPLARGSEPASWDDREAEGPPFDPGDVDDFME